MFNPLLPRITLFPHHLQYLKVLFNIDDLELEYVHDPCLTPPIAAISNPSALPSSGVPPPMPEILHLLLALIGIMEPLENVAPPKDAKYSGHSCVGNDIVMTTKGPFAGRLYWLALQRGFGNKWLCLRIYPYLFDFPFDFISSLLPS
jgi:hypothetical protein